MGVAIFNGPNDVVDVVVSVPVAILRSDFHPYGDGQSNSSLNFGSGWSEPRPQFLATLIRHSSGVTTIRFRFDRSLDLASNPWSMTSSQPEFLALLIETRTRILAETTVTEDARLGFSDAKPSRVGQTQGMDGAFPVLIPASPS